MDENVLGRIREALSITLHATSSNDQRVAAQRYIEEFKEQPNSPLLGYQLAHRTGGQDVTVRHFGFGCIEHAIKFRWSGYSAEERIQLRGLVADLLRTGTDDVIYQSRFLKEKLATIVAEVAKKTWPTEWTDFARLLQDLYGSGVGGQDLVLSILRSLGEDVFVFDNVPPGQRKKELSTSMTVVTVSHRFVEELRSKADVAALIQTVGVESGGEGWLARWTKDMVALQSQYQAAAQSRDKATAEAAERLAFSVIQTIGVTFEWILLKSIIECQTVQRLFDLLLSTSLKIRTAAIEALHVLYSRNLHQTDENRQACIVDPMFEGGGFEKFLGAWMVAHGAAAQGLAGVGLVEMTKLVGDEDVYQFLQRLAQAFAALGETHICFRKRAKSIPTGFDKYVRFMTVIGRHPSAIIASIASQFWSEALKHEIVRETPEIQGALPDLLETIFARLPILDHPETAGAAFKHYNDIDFESMTEVKMFNQQHRNKNLEIVRLVAALKPVDTLSWTAARIQAHLVAKPATPVGAADGGFLPATDPWLATLEADSALLSNVVSAIPETLLDQAKVEAKDRPALETIVMTLVATLQQLVDFDTTDPLVVRQQLPMIVACAEAMAAKPDLLLKSLQKLFTFVIFKLPGEDVNGFQRPETKELRYKALSSLVKLGVAIPDVLIQLYNDIAASIKNLVDQNLLREGEKTLVMEFALCVVFNAKVPLESKAPYIQAIMEPYVAEWSSPALSNGPLATSAGFLDFIGMNGMAQGFLANRSAQVLIVNLEPAIAQRIMDERRNRSKLNGLVNSIASFLRRTVDPKNKGKPAVVVDTKPAESIWSPYVRRIVPNLFLATKVIHETWSPSNWQSLPVELQYVTQMGLLEKKQAMGGGSMGPTGSLDDFADESLAKHLDNIRSWLVAFREASYTSIGLLSYLGNDLYAMPNLSQMILQGLFGSAEVMENRHWKSLIGGLMRPLISNCPPPFLPTILAPILPAFFTFLSNKLASEWKSRMEKGTLVDESEIVERGGMDGDGSTVGSDLIEVEDMSEEIINEKVLRLLTRSYADLMTSIFAAAPPPVRDTTQTGKDPRTPDGKRTKVANPIEDFLNKDLVQFLISNLEIAQPLLLSLSNLVHYPDLISAKRALSITTRLIPLLLKQGPAYQEYMAKELLVSALKALHDPYHTEVHGEIIGLITEIYMTLRPHSSMPLETISQIPNVDAARVQAFEAELGSKSSQKEQQAVVRAFLAGFAGVAVSQLFATKSGSSFALGDVKKSIFRSLTDRGDTHRNDLLSRSDSDGDENGGGGTLNGLFG